jgi:hypothetical protein
MIEKEANRNQGQQLNQERVEDGIYFEIGQMRLSHEPHAQDNGNNDAGG